MKKLYVWEDADLRTYYNGIVVVWATSLKEAEDLIIAELIGSSVSLKKLLNRKPQILTNRSKSRIFLQAGGDS